MKSSSTKKIVTILAVLLSIGIGMCGVPFVMKGGGDASMTFAVLGACCIVAALLSFIGLGILMLIRKLTGPSAKEKE